MLDSLVAEAAIEYMLWSPVIPKASVTNGLARRPDLQLVINGECKRRAGELQKLADTTTRDVRNPVFRLLQILEALRN